MAMVNTVAGPVDADSLGMTLMHEHIFVMDMEMALNVGNFDEQSEIENAVDAVEEMFGAGITTLVDLTVIGLGRSLSRVQAVAKRTRANIVASTGLYTYSSLPMYWHWRERRDSGLDPLTQFFIDEIEVGIRDTGVRAGMLKCATSWEGMTPGVERVVRAVGQAHVRTGVPITTHTAGGRGVFGLEQQKVLSAEGVDLTRVIIGHAGGASIDLLVQLADKGSTLGIDHFGINGFPGFPDDTVRLQRVAEMCRLGYTRQLVLSHDAHCWNNLSEAPPMPDHHFSYVPAVVVPKLAEMGVSDQDIHTMLVENPRRLLAHSGPY
jgi:phosphotriesterase-related protein